MADLVTRIILNNKQFNDNIAASKKQLEIFNKTTAGIKNVIGTFAASLGVAGGAMETFNGIMRNNQQFGDSMKEAMNAAKASVNEFFYAISSGDFSNILGGLDNVIAKSREASRMLDQLGNTSMAYSYVRSDNRRQISAARTSANNTSLSRGDRETGFEAWNAALKDLEQYAKQYREDALNTVKALAKESNRLIDVDLANVDKILRLDIQNAEARKTEKEKLEKEYTEYVKKQADIRKKYQAETQSYNAMEAMYTRSNSVTTTSAEQKAEEEALAQQYEMAILYNSLLVKKDDERLQSLYELINQANDANEELGSQLEEYTNAYQSFVNELNTSDTSSSSEIKNIEAPFKFDTDSFIDSEMATLKDRLNIASNTMDKIPLQPFTFGEKVGDVNDYTDAMYGLCDAMTAVAGIGDEGLQGWLNWSQGIMSTVLAATQAIQGLIVARQADTAAAAGEMSASQGVAGAKQAEAIATGAAEAAKTPLIGWIVAIGAIAAMIAAFASIPKFATGGIVGGNSPTGDKVLARLNSGEMILNKKQQGNLYGLLTNGGNGNGGQVEFIIKGKELVGVLSNYNNKVSKVS